MVFWKASSTSSSSSCQPAPSICLAVSMQCCIGSRTLTVLKDFNYQTRKKPLFCLSCRAVIRNSVPSRMPPGVEATLQQLDLAADAAAGPSQQFSQQQHSHSTAQHTQHADEDHEQETPAALQNTACLAATFTWLDTEESLLRCSAVCKLWQSVLGADDIWRRVYLRGLPKPLPFERVGR